MIRYALACADGHSFESWFPDSASYETQRKRGFLACPECGSTSVGKAIMAPAVVGGDRPIADPAETGPLHEKRRRVRETITRMRQEIEANTDDVGDRFPEVARAMHDGAEPERAIRGRANPEEARALIEDGVSVWPMPALADDMN
jgi:hypothetical protein